MSFTDRFGSLRKERKTVLCVGLDPALPSQRTEAVIPGKYALETDENKARLDFCLGMIDLVCESALAIKPNQQYVIGFTKKDHKQLTDYARKKGLLSILDYKLNDIGETVASGIFHLSDAGYDAVTFNPLPGNLKEAVEIAHKHGYSSRGFELGIIALTLMSNPEAEIYMKKATVDDVPMFESIARQVKDYNADGCVVGATGHVTEKDIRSIRRTVGDNKVFLVPGIGAQKGDVKKVLNAAGEAVLISVSRDIIYSENPTLKAEKYAQLFSGIIDAQ
jgi:orotidine 5'-phosphate decarboxylase subfamily 2